LDWLTASLGTSISWFSPDGNLIGEGPSHDIVGSTYADEGTYTAVCTQEDGLTDTATVTIAFPSKPTPAPTPAPTPVPSASPSSKPSAKPSAKPSTSPSSAPSTSPSAAPSTSPSAAPSFEAVAHEVCEKFAVHARTTVTFAGAMSTIHGGDVGVSPGTSITGSYTFEDGEIDLESSDFAASVLAAHAAFTEVTGEDQHMDIEIGGKTFLPGTYRSDSAINFAYGTVVTLDGNNEPNPEFRFKAGSTLITAADTHFILINGAKAEKVLWALGTAATIGARSVVAGSILAGTAITFGTESKLLGCALAQSAVTFESKGYVDVVHYENLHAQEHPGHTTPPTTPPAPLRNLRHG
jgi:hypothetical protein